MYHDLHSHTASLLQDSFELYMKMLSWAHLNFDMQSFLLCENHPLNERREEALQTLGYTHHIPENILERKQLFEREGFFSVSQTGKRIVAYVLQNNGLDQSKFEQIEESIQSAYQDVKAHYPPNDLLDKTLQHALDTLAVFKH